MAFDLIVLDPPYKKQKLVDILTTITEHDLLDDDGIIVCEHGHDVELPDEVASLTRWKHELYGTIQISIYEIKKNEM